MGQKGRKDACMSQQEWYNIVNVHFNSCQSNQRDASCVRAAIESGGEDGRPTDGRSDEPGRASSRGDELS